MNQDLKDKITVSTQAEQQKEKRILKNEESLRDLQDNIKYNNIRIRGVPEEEKSEQGIKNLFEEIVAENLLNLSEETVMQVWEAQRVPIKMN